jgi:hypothetical protein
MSADQFPSAVRPLALLLFLATPSTPPPAVVASPSPAAFSDATTAPKTDEDTQHAGKTSLPDLSVFLLGSGLALLIALLAWGEQIRAITKDTRDLERGFLEATGLTRSHLNALLQARNDDERLVAFTSIIASRKLKSALQVETLPLFERWRALGSRLRRLQSTKYWLTICLAAAFLLSGAIATLRADRLPVAPLLAIPGTLTVALLVAVVCAGRVEGQLNQLLVQIAEKV